MATEAEATAAAAPAKRGAKGLIIWIVLVLLAAGSGAAAPFLLSHAPATPHAKKPHEERAKPKPAVVQFGDVVVNLADPNLSRYLRVKVLLVVDETETKETNELLEKHKPFLKSWLISYLSDQTMIEVGRAAGVNRIRREIREEFNARLFPDGSEKIYEVLFDEFVVQ
jgi:flagellar basal body-associated protein FliL